MAGDILSQGTALYIGQSSPISSPETFTLVGGITDVGAPEASTTEIDTTDMQSEAKEYLLGLVDFGTVQLTMKYRPSDPVHQRIEALAVSHEKLNFRIVYNGGTKKEFQAMVKTYNPAASTDSIVKGPLTLRISGVVATTYPS